MQFETLKNRIHAWILAEAITTVNVENTRNILAKIVAILKDKSDQTDIVLDDWIVEKIETLFTDEDNIEIITVFLTEKLEGKATEYEALNEAILEDFSPIKGVLVSLLETVMPVIIDAITTQRDIFFDFDESDEEGEDSADKTPWRCSLKTIATIILTVFFALCLLFGIMACTVKADLYTASKAVVRISVPDGRYIGYGSGVVVSSDEKFYYALTNAHVASKKQCKVEFFDAGQVFTCYGETVYRNTETDVAMLKIDTQGKYNPTVVPVDPAYNFEANEVLATIGHPEGGMPTLYFLHFKEYSEWWGLCFIPTPKQGRSGSPILTADGTRVLGIVYAQVGEGADKVGAAIPANYLASISSFAMKGTPVKEWKPANSKKLRRLAHSILANPQEEETETDVKPEKPTSAGAKVKFNPDDTMGVELDLPFPQVKRGGKTIRERFQNRSRKSPFLNRPRRIPRPNFPNPSEDVIPESVSQEPTAQVTLTQYQTPYYPYNGTCPTCPGGVCPTPTPQPAPATPVQIKPRFPKTPEKPKEGEAKIPIKIADDNAPKSENVLPPLDPSALQRVEAEEAKKKEKPIEKTDEKATENEGELPTTQRISVQNLAEFRGMKKRVGELDAKVAELEETVATLNEKLATFETTPIGIFRDRQTLPDAAKEGLQSGIEGAAGQVIEAFRVDLTDDVKELLTSATVAMDEATVSMQTVTTSTAEATQVAQTTLISMQDYAKSVRNALFVFGFIVLVAVILIAGIRVKNDVITWMFKE